MVRSHIGGSQARLLFAMCRRTGKGNSSVMKWLSSQVALCAAGMVCKFEGKEVRECLSSHNKSECTGSRKVVV